jgi:hypothetical protein
MRRRLEGLTGIHRYPETHANERILGSYIRHRSPTSARVLVSLTVKTVSAFTPTATTAMAVEREEEELG